MRTQIISVVLLLALSGCTANPSVPTNTEKTAKAEFAKCKLDAKINQHTRRFVTGVKEVLESKENLSREEQVSLDLTEQAERLLGGEPIEKIDVNALLALYGSNKEKYKQKIGEWEKTATIIKTSGLDNQTKIAALDDQLEKEKAGNPLWKRIKNMGASTIILTIIVVILLLILATDILGQLKIIPGSYHHRRNKIAGQGRPKGTRPNRRTARTQKTQ